MAKAASRRVPRADEFTEADPALLVCAVEAYETDRLDFAEAYIVAHAESTGISKVASFDRTLDRVGTIEPIRTPSG